MKFANNPKKIDSFFVYYMSQNNGYFLPQIPGSTDAEKIDIYLKSPVVQKPKKSTFLSLVKKTILFAPNPLILVSQRNHSLR